MFSQRCERSRLLYPSRYPEGPPEENLSPAKRCWSAKFVSRHIHPVLINVECWICDNCWRWRERLIAAVAGRVKLLEVTTGSPLASHEHPDFKAAWPNRVLTISLVVYREYYTNMNYYTYAGEFSCFCSYTSTHGMACYGLEVSLANSYSLAFSKFPCSTECAITVFRFG